jgi:hypothetical protein
MTEATVCGTTGQNKNNENNKKKKIRQPMKQNPDSVQTITNTAFSALESDQSKGATTIQPTIK